MSCQLMQMDFAQGRAHDRKDRDGFVQGSANPISTLCVNGIYHELADKGRVIHYTNGDFSDHSIAVFGCEHLGHSTINMGSTRKYEFF